MPAGRTEGMIKSFVAGAAIAEYDVVKLNSTGGAVKANDDDEFLVGVAQHSANMGDSVAVQISGIAEVKADGAVTAGAPVTATDTADHFGQVETQGQTGKYMIGWAMVAAADGDIFPILLFPGVWTST